METIGDRLRGLIYSGLKSNVSQFSQELGYKGNQNLAKVINNQTKNPGVDLFERISKTFPEVSLDYLISGNGEMFKTQGEPETNPMIEMVEEMRQHNEYMRQLTATFVKI